MHRACCERPRIDRHRRAFTLIEILVVIVIVAALIGLLAPMLSGAREQARRMRCLSNQRQLIAAMIVYSDDDRLGVYISSREISDDGLHYIIPRYVANPDVAICPSTDDSIRRDVSTVLLLNGEPADVLEDLTRTRSNQASLGLPAFGHSYEVYSFFGRSGGYLDGRAFDDNELMTSRNADRPSQMYITLDADDTGINNWPEAIDNHGTDGLQLGFLDGHAAWVDPVGFVMTSLESYHPFFNVDAALEAVPNLQLEGDWDGTWSLE